MQMRPISALFYSFQAQKKDCDDILHGEMGIWEDKSD